MITVPNIEHFLVGYVWKQKLGHGQHPRLHRQPGCFNGGCTASLQRQPYRATPGSGGTPPFSLHVTLSFTFWSAQKELQQPERIEFHRIILPAFVCLENTVSQLDRLSEILHRSLTYYFKEVRRPVCKRCLMTKDMDQASSSTSILISYCRVSLSCAAAKPLLR